MQYEWMALQENKIRIRFHADQIKPKYLTIFPINNDSSWKISKWAIKTKLIYHDSKSFRSKFRYFLVNENALSYKLNIAIQDFHIRPNKLEIVFSDIWHFIFP